jgi:hypothetical protein
MTIAPNLKVGQLELLVQDDPLGDLIALALALGARRVPGWSAEEERRALCAGSARVSHVEEVEARIGASLDPLGDRYLAAFSAEQGRPRGATFTPPEIVGAMLDWAQTRPTPVRVVDPGTGSGRFLIEAGRRFTDALSSGGRISWS